MRNQGFSRVRRRPKPWLIALIIVGHVVGFYLLARALVPDLTGAAIRDVSSALTVVVTAPEEEEPEPPAPDPEPEPDEGAQGAPGKKATPKPVDEPEPKIKIAEKKPAPKASSTGAANTSGAKDEGEGTGASGTGDGTGSGQGGSGRGGGIPVTKPEHVSGTINNARDYPVPAGGRKARRGTRVVVKVTVGTSGRASNCSIYRASPDPEADRLTCELVVGRLGFKPAQDANGDPVAAPFYWQQKWF